jgi:osmotically-inducible protein OsmY
MAARDAARNQAARDRREEEVGWPARAGRDPAVPDREAFYARHGFGPGDYAGRGVSGPAAEGVTGWYGGEATGQVRPEQHVRARDQRGKGPKGYRRRDERILEDLSDWLTDDSWIDAGGVEIRVENGEVTLDGTVGNRAARRRAEDIALSVPGVAHVQNNLRVGGPVGRNEA